MKHNDQAFKEKQLKRVSDNQAFKHGYISNMAFALLVLNDKFDFTEEQLNQFIDEAAELLDSYNKDLLTFEDICETLKEETGITLQLN